MLYNIIKHSNSGLKPIKNDIKEKVCNNKFELTNETYENNSASLMEKNMKNQSTNKLEKSSIVSVSLFFAHLFFAFV